MFTLTEYGDIKKYNVPNTVSVTKAMKSVSINAIVVFNEYNQ